MIIGCVSLIFVEKKIVSLKCGKGRGLILPGGKWEPGETFQMTASRELREETGLVAKTQELIFGGLTPDYSYCYTFLTTIYDYNPVSSLEGTVELSTWDELCTSFFGPYYELLRHLPIFNNPMPSPILEKECYTQWE